MVIAYFHVIIRLLILLQWTRVKNMDNKEDIGLYRYGTPVVEQIYNNVVRLLESKIKHVDLQELTGVSSQMIGYMRKTLIE